MRVIDNEGEQLGLMSAVEAIALAAGRGLDLVEVSPNAKPPVCRIMDYGKYKFEAKKQQNANKKKTKQVQIKEIKFRPRTEEGDYQTKVRKLREFMEKGDKIKVTLRYRGREFAHQELGLDLLKRVAADLDEFGSVDQMPKMEGRQMVMMMSPKKLKV
ncbi:Translation initiation factor 3 [hydrothermal vent metagenome]|uniref:Translation initiation factor 3 n=1 Tax=hydrothermal vent metagenome TaxID=652676 RepID=A0A3B0XUY0_9ZZZZ